MKNLRKLLQIVDSLPDQSLERAELVLEYCANSEQHRMNIQKANRRLFERSKRRLREHSERTRQGFISTIGRGGGMTLVGGDHHSSMIAFEDGKDATAHFYVYRGTPFEITETIEISDDGQRLIRRERTTANDGTEQALAAALPVRHGDK